jgi:hypothetical protein
MLSARLIHLIETHADTLTREALHDILTNPRTPSFQRVPRAELEPRVHALFRNLGSWIGAPKDEAIRAEYEDWGRRRYRLGIPLSEIMYTLVIAKHHLRRYIRDHGLVEFAGERTAPLELLPVHLYGVQELNAMVGEFFDLAMYYLACGYEAEAREARAGTARSARAR